MDIQSKPRAKFGLEELNCSAFQRQKKIRVNNISSECRWVKERKEKDGKKQQRNGQRGKNPMGCTPFKSLTYLEVVCIFIV